MLKGIPNILPPELLKILMEMGHGDELVIGDGNFPSANYGQRLIRLDGHSGVDVLTAILQLFPLDTFVKNPTALMAVPANTTQEPPIWEQYRQIIKDSGEPQGIEYIERFSFYDRSKEAYAIVATGERALYANLILKKGVVVE